VPRVRASLWASNGGSGPVRERRTGSEPVMIRRHSTAIPCDFIFPLECHAGFLRLVCTFDVDGGDPTVTYHGHITLSRSS
jgi:hypothetical protein